MQRKHFTLKLAMRYPKLSNLKRKGDLSHSFGDQKSKQNATNVGKARGLPDCNHLMPDDIMSRVRGEITQ